MSTPSVGHPQYTFHGTFIGWQFELINTFPPVDFSINFYISYISQKYTNREMSGIFIFE